MTKNTSYRSNYRILGQIGQGQFGQVYFAIERKTGNFVALKSLGKGFPTNRFLREFSCLVSLRHPNIVACKAIEYHGKGRYLVMDYCEGETLRNLMNFSAQLSLVTCLDLMIDILAGLEEAHQHNIIHCDIKPENILLTLTAEKWIAKVTDFGIAKMGQDQANNDLGRGYTGSPAYMAPERFYGKYSPACDIYSVGIILYELMLGERPFSGLPGNLMLAHLNQRVNIPNTVPDALKEIMLKALEKLPQRRFSSAKAMLNRIVDYRKNLNFTKGKNQLFKAINIESLHHSITELAALSVTQKINHISNNNETIYIALENKLMKFKKTSINLTKSDTINVESSIKSIVSYSQGCLILTQTKEKSSNQYNFYNCQENYQPEEGLINQHFPKFNGQDLKFAINQQGSWLAIIYKTKVNEITAELQIINLANSSTINYTKPCPFPSQLISLDQRYGLAIFPRINQGNKRTYIYLFNRRGRFIKGFPLPLLISQLIPHKVNSFELFGIETVKPNYGILIKLNPLKIKRIPLDIIPDFIISEVWGYGLADKTGQILLLDTEGDYLGKINLGVTITAITGLNKDQLLVATWDNEQGKLLILNTVTQPSRL
ncbi:MAG: serine/threonine-protein kinase [Crocosphaera sp.]